MTTITIQSNNTLLLSEEINFSNAMSIYTQSIQTFNHDATQTTWQIDFSKLKVSHSVVVALMIEWKKWAEKNNKKIQLTHLSKDILSIAKVGGVEELLSN